jgi:hypothetical protein
MSLVGHGVSLTNVLTILQFVNNLHHLQQDLQAIPQDVLHAVEQITGLIGEQATNFLATLSQELHLQPSMHFS